jgi:PAS fold
MNTRLIDRIGCNTVQTLTTAFRDELALLIKSLQALSSVSYVLDEQFRFVYCNPAWDAFAIANGAPKLALNALAGQPLFDAIPSVLQPFYASGFRRVQAGGESWEHLYECSSAHEFRRYKMRIDPILGGWFLIRHTLVVKRAHEKPVRPGSHNYVADSGFITVCCNCRRCRRTGKAQKWDFVPEYVANPPRTLEPILCPDCLDQYYLGTHE